MEAVKFEFDYWKALDKHIKETYPNKIVFIYDNELSFFDADGLPLVNPALGIFDSIEEFKEWVNSYNADAINYVQNLSVLWVNGERDEKIIYELRG